MAHDGMAGGVVACFSHETYGKKDVQLQKQMLSAFQAFLEKTYKVNLLFLWHSTIRDQNSHRVSHFILRDDFNG